MSPVEDIGVGESMTASDRPSGFARLWLVCIEAALLLVLSIGAYSGVTGNAHPLIVAVAWFPSALKSAAFAGVFTGCILLARYRRQAVDAFRRRAPPRALVGANVALFFALAGWLLWTPPLRDVSGSLQDARAILYLASPAAWLAFGATSALILFPASAIRRALAPQTVAIYVTLASAMFAYFYFGLPIGERQTDALIRLTISIASAIFGLLGGSITFAGYDADGHPIYAAGSFVVAMEPSCSGTQGMLLVTLIALLFVALEHRRLRIGRVLVLVPLLAVLMFLVNATRIAVLFHIGVNWSPEIAINGFHANFGVLSVAVVSVLFVALVQLAPAFTNAPSSNRVSGDAPSGDEDAARLVLPLAVLIGVSLVTGLFTGSFYWLYPIHALAAAVALYWSREAFVRQFDDISLLAVATGVVVFLLWIALIPPDDAASATFAAALFGAPAWLAAIWLTIRLVGSVMTVPLAEEMAFRGFLQPFLARHLRGFVDARLAAAGGLAGAALAFGLVHAHMLAGAVAGIFYGLIFLHRSRLGDAVVAHAVTNFLITLYVLIFGTWSYW